MFKYIFKHLKCIFKLKKVENTISVSTCVSRTLEILGFLQLNIYIYSGSFLTPRNLSIYVKYIINVYNKWRRSKCIIHLTVSNIPQQCTFSRAFCFNILKTSYEWLLAYTLNFLLLLYIFATKFWKPLIF